uniref:sialic acid-binding Ig-like lectin 5 n=1 Tax=Doryrhamphus excisus TaxID=161450 RepID=UPI0025AE6E5B|nr:sialic acid-binding Ig-like lectin 5 [Doryrhamphus excisus]XP_057939413.1 sialic acid-binding Ig-like lectin 5 [Doryrhamphus excisus]
MFGLIWTTLLVHLSSSKGASQGDGDCMKGFCILLSKPQIRSEAGLCAVLPCSYSAARFSPHSVVWFKCDPAKARCSDWEIVFHSKNEDKVMDAYKGRVSLLEEDVSRKNCSIIINDLNQSDSGSYQLRVNGHLLGKPEGFSFPWRVSLTVEDLEQKPTLSVPPLTAGRRATLACTAPGLCSGHAPTISWAVISGNGTVGRKNEGVTAVTQRHSSTLTFDPSALHHRTRVTCKVAYKGGNLTTEETAMLNVSYVRPPSITGQTAVKEGHALNLTCSVDSFPPSRVTWRLLRSNATIPPPGAGTARLAISNVSAAQSGRYVCTANHPAATLTAHVDVTVTWFANILDGSGCAVRADVLTCVCVSGGVPLPVVTWPLLEKRTRYRAVTVVSDHTVNTSITLTLGDANLSAVACVSEHKDGRDMKLFPIERKRLEPEDQSVKAVLRPDVIIALLVGALLSAILCLVPRMCCRKTTQPPGNPDVELLAPQEEGQETSVKMDGEAKADVEYANINFSALRRNNPRDAAAKHQATEYAEIKRAADSNGGKPEHLMERPDEEATAEDGSQEEEEEEEEALYSNVKDAMM